MKIYNCDRCKQIIIDPVIHIKVTIQKVSDVGTTSEVVFRDYCSKCGDFILTKITESKED